MTCTCEKAGWCETRGRFMGARLHQLCQRGARIPEETAVSKGGPSRVIDPTDLPCVHRGIVTRQERCRLEQCVGGPLFEVFACAKHGECSIQNRAVPGLAVCKTCKDRSERKQVAPVAVIIPCHNYGRFLPEALDSLNAQTMLPAEIVVVDDASTDDTAEVCERYGVRRIGVNCRNVNESRRVGMVQTKSPLLCFLDADDKLATDYLAAAVAALDADRGAAIAYTDMMTFGADSGRMTHPRDPAKADITRENYIHAGSVVRRVAVESVCGLDRPKLPLSLEDWELWRAIMAIGWKAVKTHSLYHYRKHEGSMSWRIVQRRASYFDLAALEREHVTIAIPLSGRAQWWPRMADWLERQTWPKDQVRLVLVNTSADESFAIQVRGWLASCDYDDIQYVRMDVGLPGLADADRHRDEVYRDVQRAMPRIYNRIRQEIATPYTLIVEDDVLPPVDAIDRLMRGMEQDTVSVSGAYRSRYQAGYVAWDRQCRVLTEPGNGLQVVGGTGFGCVMLRASVFRQTVLHHGGKNGDFDPNFFEDIAAGGWVAKIDWRVRCDHAGLSG